MPVDAVIVIGLVALWATNATDIAIAWTIGDVGNTVLFGAFAFLAVREVGGRLDKLGGDQVSDTSVVPEKLSVGSQQSALDLLVALAQQQRAVGMYNMYKPYPPALTSPRGIYSLAALQAAEQGRLLGPQPRDVAGRPMGSLIRTRLWTSYSPWPTSSEWPGLRNQRSNIRRAVSQSLRHMGLRRTNIRMAARRADIRTGLHRAGTRTADSFPRIRTIPKSSDNLENCRVARDRLMSVFTCHMTHVQSTVPVHTI